MPCPNCRWEPVDRVGCDHGVGQGVGDRPGPGPFLASLCVAVNVPDGADRVGPDRGQVGRCTVTVGSLKSLTTVVL